MDRTTFAFSFRPRRNAQPTLSTHYHPLLHPALAYPSDDSVLGSLDLSFQRSIAVSRIDRNIIDNLSRART